MITINELRIGNWLINYSGEYYPLTFFTFETYFAGGGKKNAAIPLTKDILIKCGFKMTNIIAQETMHLSPLHLQKEPAGWYIRWNAGYVNKKPLLHLHVLQNLYFVITDMNLHST